MLRPYKVHMAGHKPESDTTKAFWGNAEWRAMHCKAAMYTPDHAESFKAYIYSLVELLPCEVCRGHWKENLTQFPVENYLDRRENLFFWTYLMHDQVNQQLGKTSPPYDAVVEMYWKIFDGECSNCKV